MSEAVCPLCNHTGELGAPCPTHRDRRLVDPIQLERHRGKGVLLGRVLAGRFALVRVLGKGGMGWVYEAIQEPIGRRVALKVLRDDHAADEVVRERFLREAMALGQLQHANLVTLYDYGTVHVEPDDADGADDSGEMLFIAMELLRGQTLADVLARPRFFAAARLLRVAEGIAAGLAEAHRGGIVHRDLKPENVLLVRDSSAREVVKLVDFGIARLSNQGTLTQTGMVFGTPIYMSPEQCAGQREVGPPADVYAFGILLFQMLTGSVPFDGRKPLQVLMQHINKPTPPLVLRDDLAVPADLVALTRACLEKTPEDRPADGTALSQRLARIGEQLLAGETLVTGEGEPATPERIKATLDGKTPSLDRAEVAGNPTVAHGANKDTIVLGGSVELDPHGATQAARDTRDTVDAIDAVDSLDAGDALEPDTLTGDVPAEPRVLSAGSQEDIPTLLDATRADANKSAYRVAPRGDGPSQLRGGGGTATARKLPTPVWLALGAVLLLVVGIGAGLALSGGGSADDDDDSSRGTPAAPDDPAPSPTPARDEPTTTSPAGSPAPSGNEVAPDDLQAMSDAALLRRHDELQNALETARQTAIGDDHRRNIELGYWEQLRPIIEEMARRGLQPSP